MATIITDSQQVKALEEIQEALSVIKAINSITDDSTDGAELQVLKVPTNGRSTKVIIGTNEVAKLYSVMQSQKQRLVKEITSRASKYHINLDDADKACMGL